MTEEAFEKHFVDISQSGYESGLVDMINSHGYATFDGIQSHQHILDIAKRFGQPKSLGTDLIKLKDQNELPLHTDGNISTPPFLIFLYCESPAAKGGESLLVDGKNFYLQLREKRPNLLRLMECDKGEFENYDFGFSRNNIFISDENHFIEISYASGGLNHRYDMEDKAFSAGLLQELEDVFTLQKGQVYVVNNFRCLHGRKSFSGERIAYRIHLMGDNNTEFGKQIMRGFEAN